MEMGLFVSVTPFFEGFLKPTNRETGTGVLAGFLNHNPPGVGMTSANHGDVNWAVLRLYKG